MHVGRSVAAVAAIGTMMGVVPELSAQNREGFWFGVAIGPGWQLDEPPAGLTSFGGAWSLRFGGTPTRWLRLGGEALIWGTSSEGVTRGNGNAMAIAQAYPVRDIGLYVKGGLGLAGAISEGNTVGTSTNSGFGTGLGVGYEFNASESFLITIGADLMVQVIDFGSGGTSTSPYAIFTVGIGTP